MGQIEQKKFSEPHGGNGCHPEAVIIETIIAIVGGKPRFVRLRFNSLVEAGHWLHAFGSLDPAAGAL